MNEEYKTRTFLSSVSAFAGSVFFSILLISILEALRIPRADYHGVVASFLFSLFYTTNGAVEILWLPAVFQLFVAVTLTLRSFLPNRRLILIIIELAILLCAVIFCHVKLVEYRPFAWYPPFMALHFIAFIGLAVWSVFFPLFEDTGKGKRATKMLGRYFIPGVAVVLFFVMHFANYILYYDRYPTLHTSLLMTSYLFLQAGLLTFFRSLTLFKSKPAVVIAIPTILGVIVIISAVLSRLPAAQPYSARFFRFSVIGQELSRNTLSTGKKSELTGVGSFDPNGVQRFAEQSKLPALPDDFDLLKHNILLVSIETFRADESSLKNPELNLTPKLLNYAKNGSHWFTRAYAGSSYTLQSIAGILTMSYTSSTGLEIYDPRWNGYLPEEFPTIADHLEHSGYDTFWVPYTGGASEDGILDWAWPRFSKVSVQRGDEAVLAEVKRELSRRKNDSRRFFGWVFFPGPHAPFRTHYKDMPSETNKDRYRQELRYIDGVVDRLLTHIKKTGLDKNTVIIIHGDHGEEFKDHGKTGHESLYSECSIVPLIIRIPKVKGKRSTLPTSLNYVFPWLFSHGDHYLQGIAKSRMETIFGPVLEATEGAVVSELFGTGYGTRSLLAYKDYHFHHDFASNHHELYNLRKDPREKKNIFDPSKALSKKLLKRFERYVEVRERNMNVSFTSGTADRQESEKERNARKLVIKKLKSADEVELVDALRDSGDWRVQIAVIGMLSTQKDLADETIDEMIKLLVAQNRELRKRANRIHREINPNALAKRLLQALRTDSPLSKLSYSYGTDKVRTMSEVAKNMLNWMGVNALPSIIEALKSDDIELLVYACNAVKKFPTKAQEAIPLLTKLENHRNREVSKNARESLSILQEHSR